MQIKAKSWEFLENIVAQMSGSLVAQNNLSQLPRVVITFNSRFLMPTKYVDASTWPGHSQFEMSLFNLL